VSEFLDWLQQAVFEAETGRASAKEIRARLLVEWGGVRVVVPKIDPVERLQIKALIDKGTAERTARAFVRGK
jgi:hypothetical protein